MFIRLVGYRCTRRQHLWALDAGLENTLSSEEMVHRSARRVGLDVPDLYTETQADEERKKAAAAEYLAKKRMNEPSVGQ